MTDQFAPGSGVALHDGEYEMFLEFSRGYKDHVEVWVYSAARGPRYPIFDTVRIDPPQQKGRWRFWPWPYQEVLTPLPLEDRIVATAEGLILQHQQREDTAEATATQLESLTESMRTRYLTENTSDNTDPFEDCDCGWCDQCMYTAQDIAAAQPFTEETNTDA